MNITTRYIILIQFCFIINANAQLIDPSLYRVIDMYVTKYDSITNKCQEQPFYKLYFENNDNTIGFWIAAHLGEPSLIPPVPPGEKDPANPMVIKGITFVNGMRIVIYDFRNSNGYGLYNVKMINKKWQDKFQSIPNYCSNVAYPEAWYYEILGDSLVYKKSRAPYVLQ